MREKFESLCKALLAFSLVSLFAYAVTRGLFSGAFERNCEKYIVAALHSEGPLDALPNLDMALRYLEENGLSQGSTIRTANNDVALCNLDRWYASLQKARAICADGFPRNSTDIDVTLRLMRSHLLVRGSPKSSLFRLWVPNDISVYPYQELYFWWGLGSLVLTVVFLFAWAVIHRT